MTETHNLILARLPRDLSAIVLGYFQAGNQDLFAIAQAGEYEACIARLEAGYVPPNPAASILVGACNGGHIEIVRFIVNFVSSWESRDRGMRHACDNDHIETAVFMLEHVSSLGTNNILFKVLASGRRELAWSLINLGQRWFRYAHMVAHGQVDALLSSGIWPPINEITLNFYLAIACLGNQANMIHLMVEQGATACELCGRSPKGHLGQLGPN